MKIKKFFIPLLFAGPLLFADAPAKDVIVHKLWDGPPPGSIADPSYRENEDTVAAEPPLLFLKSISEPRVEVYLPKKGKGTGAAVVICPGGGYGGLAYTHEGRNFARWFQERGVAGIVLLYRLPSDRIMTDKSIGPLQDVQQAIRLTRRNAAAWGIATDKVGIMGFSAGGHLAASASTLYNEKVYPVNDNVSARPDFSLLIYGVLSFQDAVAHKGSRENLLGKQFTEAQRDRFSTELHVDASTPPTFLAHATDDDVVPPENSILYYSALKKYHIPTELHLYEFGGHGFGMRESGPKWLGDLENWLRLHHWVTSAAVTKGSKQKL